MFCKHCGSEMPPKGVQCFKCGQKKRQPLKMLFIILLFLSCSAGAALTAYLWGDFHLPVKQQPAVKVASKANNPQKSADIKQPVAAAKPLPKAHQKKLTEIIAEAQETVYTVFADTSQGSGFLYDNSGHVVTNAHVVEGSISVEVKTKNGRSLSGRVIGYSNEVDLAVLSVPDLAGTAPYPIEKESQLAIGEEVIALGSPLGMENTATMGYITGKDRNFTIGQFTYDSLYQTSAKVAPGSSGGPLVSIKSKKITAINSAQSTLDTTMGFSIPLYKVSAKIQSWISKPMTQEEIEALFYGEDGSYFFEDLWNDEEGYFDEGDYSEDDSYYDYWEYDYDDDYDSSDEYDYNDEYDNLQEDEIESYVEEPDYMEEEEEKIEYEENYELDEEDYEIDDEDYEMYSDENEDIN